MILATARGSGAMRNELKERARSGISAAEGIGPVDFTVSRANASATEAATIAPIQPKAVPPLGSRPGECGHHYYRLPMHRSFPAVAPAGVSYPFRVHPSR